ncbi:MAG TPA: DNA gyrase inhibitor YacG [Pyrinomonadaceae bacterium]|nr:DNA gyrase inhibitor YacG [Pyrinomonadaceae bacterium]
MKCPTCGKPTEWENNRYVPFCSERCKLIDLGAWVNEEYSVPGETAPVPEGSEDLPQHSIDDELET